eukprot:TRINITY_DN19545_c0_g1_i1.p1 TRINITY_DN19545_c0_g1~~TRINITY_DN19545_c0_g1_i1.p1  ORF type:complete len:300 (-),score=50.16 TRINITY_DN19545_c0_g1_i1:65-964(-)
MSTTDGTSAVPSLPAKSESAAVLTALPCSSPALLSLKGKKAVITGGSRGIGLSIAKLFVDLGAEILICSRDEESLDAARKTMSDPSKCSTVVADLSTFDGIRALVAGCAFENVHILVNNVGMNIRKKAEDFSAEEFRTVFTTNFFSAYDISVAFLPWLRQAGGASVVNISSVAGMSHVPSGCAYGSSKAAMDQMTRTLAVEWARFGIRVNSCNPGPINTDLIRRANQAYLDAWEERLPLGRFGESAEVANVVAFLAGGMSTYVTGQCLAVDGGWTATGFNEVPGFWDDASRTKKRRTEE